MENKELLIVCIKELLARKLKNKKLKELIKKGWLIDINTLEITKEFVERI